MSIKNKKRKQNIILIGTLLILTVLIGFSYSMFTANVRKTNETGTAIKTKVMGLIYTGQSDIDEENILPGSSFTKTFTVENVTDEAMWYNIYMENITNDYGEDLVYTLYETDSNYENIIKTVVSETKLPETTSGKSYLKTRIDIEAKPKTQYYKMVITYKETSVAQEYDSDAEFEGTVGIDQEEVTPPVLDEDFTITINPNGGTYNETPELTTVVRHGGETYEVLVPTRVGHEFDGWEVSEPATYKNNIVTVYNKDVTLKAKWILTDETNAVAMIVRTGTKYARIQEAEDAAVNDDTIKILKNTSEVFANEKTVTIDFDDNTVTGKLNNTGNITLINGTLQNENDYAINNTGTLTLGINDGTVERENIIIKSDVDHSALSQSGTMNFYDGYVEGLLAIVGPVNTTAEGYVVFTEHKEQNNKSWQKAYLVDEESLIAYVKRIDGTDMYYNDLQDAVDVSMEVGKTVYAIADFDATSTHIDEEALYDIVFDINGHNVRLGDTVTNNKNLTITNSKNFGQLLPSHAIINNSNLQVKNIIITMTQTASNAIENKGALTIENSTITAGNSYAISNTENGNIVMDSNTYLHSNNYALYNNTTDIVTIENGNVYGVYNNSKLLLKNNTIYNNGTNDAIYNTINGILTTDGVEVESTRTGLANSQGTVYFNGNIDAKESAISSGGTVELNGGVIIGRSTGRAIFLDFGTLIMNDGEIYAPNGEGVYMNHASMTMNGGYIESKNAGIAQTYGYNVTMTGGTVKSTNSVGIHNTSHTLSITGGTVIGKTYGIQVASTTNIGTNNAELLSVPVIIGEQYGIYTTGTTNFYDGVLKGKTAGYYGTINQIPDGTIIKDGTEIIESEEYQTNYLEAERNFLEIDFGNDDVREYNSFNKAIADIPEDNENPITIKVTAGGIVDADKVIIKAPVKIPSNKKVRIDMNSKTLDFTQSIINNGELIIADDSNDKNGTLTTSSTINIVTNNKTATLENVKFVKNNTTNQAIYNSVTGTLTTTGIEIESTGTGLSNYQGTVYFNGNIDAGGYAISSGGTTEINGGVIIGRSTARAIFLDFGTLIMNDGEIYAPNGDGVYMDHAYTTINDGYIESKNAGIAQTFGYTVTINGGTVKSTNSVGINNNQGKINIKGGTVIGKTYGIKVASTTNIGTNNAELLSVPVIIGEQYGIYTTGTTNFYDGVLKGKTAGYYGTINQIPDGTIIKDGTEIIESEEYQTNYLEAERNFLEIDFGNDDIREYNSFNKAIADIPENNENPITIKVTAGGIVDADKVIIKAPVTIPSNKKVRIDMNSKTLDFTQSIINNGELIIADDSNDKNGTLTTSSTINIVTNNKTATLENVKFVKNNTTNQAIYNSVTGTLTATGIEIESTGIGLSNNQGTVYFNGNIDAGGNAISSGGTVELNGGVIIGRSTARAIFLDFGTLIMNDGEIYAPNGDGVYMDHASMTMNDGYIESKNAGIAQTYGYNVTMTGGTVKSTNSVGIHNNSHTLNITGGTVIGKTYGIQVVATTNIGINNAEILSVPVIIGEQYGIYTTTGVVNYYDGILKGKTDGYYGNFTNIIDHGYIATTTEQDPDDLDHPYTKNYLELETNIITNRTKANAKYNNIQDAIDAASAGDTLIIETDDGIKKEISIYYPITINKDVTIDLNGYNLFTSKTITNSSNTTIINNDLNNSSTISTIFAREIIINSATLQLTLSNINLNNTNTANNCFTNNGIAIINNVSVNSINGINNSTNGMMNITNSTITATKTALSNTGTLVIDGGTYTGPNYGIYDNSTKTNTIENVTSNIVLINNNSTYTINDSTFTTSFTNRGNTTVDDNVINGTLYNYGTLAVTDTDLDTTITNSGTMSVDNSDNIRTSQYSNYGSYTLVTNSGNLEINNSEFSFTNENNAMGLYVVNVTGSGEFTCNSCEINITNKRDSYGVRTADANSKMNLNNITINIYGDNTYAGYGINTNKGTANMTSGNINVMNKQNSYGLYTNGGTTTILDGNIIAKDSTNAYGIYTSAGTVILGEPEEGEYRGTENATVSVTDPYIKGIGTTTGIGVKNVNGSIKFYDGLLVGSTEAKPDALTDKEYHYDPAFGIDSDGYQTCYLVYNPVATD